jgi:hypothetical protein
MPVSKLLLTFLLAMTTLKQSPLSFGGGGSGGEGGVELAGRQLWRTKGGGGGRGGLPRKTRLQSPRADSVRSGRPGPAREGRAWLRGPSQAAAGRDESATCALALSPRSLLRCAAGCKYRFTRERVRAKSRGGRLLARFVASLRHQRTRHPTTAVPPSEALWAPVGRAAPPRESLRPAGARAGAGRAGPMLDSGWSGKRCAARGRGAAQGRRTAGARRAAPVAGVR